MIRRALQDIQFEWPWALVLLLLLPAIYWWLQKKGRYQQPVMVVSALPPLVHGYNLKTALRNLPDILKALAFVLIIISMAMPFRYRSLEINRGKGIEIVLCLDISGSMLAQDFKPNRLIASQEVARDFIEKRKGDKIGLVIFSGQSLTLCPITTDHTALLYQLNNINYGILKDGTSIGSGLASGVERLRQGDAITKVILLLTDGEDTGGLMSPTTAKDIAKTFGIKVYTIGMGTEGYAEVPYQTSAGTVMEKEKVSIDETLLETIAAETGGKYFRAKNRPELEQIYTDIDSLEKSDIKTTVFNKKEYAFAPIAAAALILLLLSWLLQYTWLRRFP
jgi:Ca-activated chloride channel homolog